MKLFLEKKSIDKRQVSVFYLVMFFLLIIFNVKAQSNKSFVSFSGMFSMSYDNYSYSTLNYDSFRARSPKDLLKISANSTIRFGKYFSIPIGINFTNQKVSYYIPELPEEGIANYIRSPRNNFHINPTYKWARLDLGTNVTKYSELTTGDVRVFGVGFEINPGNFIMSANYGESQIAVEPSEQYHIQGAYKQDIVSGRIGYGKVKGAKFTLNIVKVKDDVNSLQAKPVGIKPIEGLSFSPLLELKLFKSVTFKTETGVSLTTKDLFADNDIINYDNKFMNINNSSIADFAHVSSLKWQGKKIHIGGEFRYIGPGYLFAGYRNTETDLIDYKLITGLNLLKNHLSINAVVGIRTNNIRNTKIEKNNRFIGNINIFTQLTKALSINASYSNFGFRNSSQDPLLKVQMVNSAYSLSPTYQINRKTNVQQISATASLNSFEQYDYYRKDFVNTSVNSYNAAYVINFTKKGLSLGTNVLVLQNKSEYLNLDLINYTVHGSYKFLKKSLQTSLYATLSNYKRDNFSADNKINVRAKLKYRITKKTNASVSYSLNNNQYGSLRPGAISNENKIQFKITQKF